MFLYYAISGGMAGAHEKAMVTGWKVKFIQQIVKTRLMKKIVACAIYIIYQLFST